MDSHAVSLAEWCLQYLRKNAADKNKTALIFADAGTSKTWEDLYRDTVCLAEHLKDLAIKDGDFVGTVVRNCYELFPSALGCIMVGAVVVSTGEELSLAELKQNLTLTKPKILLAGKTSIPDVEKAVSKLNPRPLIYDILDFYNDAVCKKGTFDLEKFVPTTVEYPDTHRCVCWFSSGTTGARKAILSADSVFIIKHTAYLQRTYGRSNASVISVAPPIWVSWWLICFLCLKYNCPLIFLDKSEAECLANAIHKYKPSVWSAALPYFIANLEQLTRQQPGRWDISSLKIIFSLGDVLQPRIHKCFQEKLGIPIYQLYGSMETVALPVFEVDFNSPPVFGSVGKPISKVKIAHLDTKQEITVPNQPGELHVLGITTEYFNNPEATKNAFDQDGWYKTGDVLYFNEDGHYFVVGRLKEMFKYKNYPVFPQEIEVEIKLIPGVADAVVVGKKVDTATGEVPTAFVVKEPNSTLTEQDIKDHLEKLNVHESKRLRGGVIFVENLPRNVTRKIVRHKLQEIANKFN